MSPWRLEQLWRVYQVASHELTRELETDRIQDVPQTLPGHAEFVKGLPVRYLRAHSSAEIATHLQLYEQSRPTGVAVQLDRIEGVYRLTVIARDMPALFASFAGALSSFGLDILKAEAFSNAKGLILDTFVFADPKRTLDLNPPEVERLHNPLTSRAALPSGANSTTATPPFKARAKSMSLAPQSLTSCATARSRNRESAPSRRRSNSIPRPATRPRWSRSSPRTGPACSTAWQRSSLPARATSM
jgi:UTP:GlnB (protein PII) uridylyltransferase